MTLDEAIKHCEGNAKQLNNEYEYYDHYDEEEEIRADECLECAKEHEQLAEWLTQLKRLKEAYESDYQIDDLIQVCLDIWG